MQSASPYSPLARSGAALIAFVAAGSIALRIALYMIEGEPLLEITWWLLRFFTIITNLLVAGTFLAIALGRAAPPRWILCMSTAIVGLGIVYHTLLARLLEHEGWEIVADQGVHTAAPILTALWFLAFVPAGKLRWRDVPWVIAWPAIYTVYALVRGHNEGGYVYFFLDASALGVDVLLRNIIGLSLFFMAVGALMLGGLKWRANTGRSD